MAFSERDPTLIFICDITIFMFAKTSKGGKSNACSFFRIQFYNLYCSKVGMLYFTIFMLFLPGRGTFGVFCIYLFCSENPVFEDFFSYGNPISGKLQLHYFCLRDSRIGKNISAPSCHAHLLSVPARRKIDWGNNSYETLSTN